jgi:hypothetical protein
MYPARQRIQATPLGRRYAWCIGSVGDDHGDARIRDAASVDAVRNGDEVRAASREKYAEGMHELSGEHHKSPPRARNQQETQREP